MDSNTLTWKGNRFKHSYFVTVTSAEVICYVKELKDAHAQSSEIPEQNVSRCSHAAFRAGELQDWVLLQMGDEVLMDVLSYLYEVGTSKEQIQRNDRTIQQWQMLPVNLVLS